MPYTGETLYDLIKKIYISNEISYQYTKIFQNDETKQSKINHIINMFENQLPNIITKMVINGIMHDDIAFRNLTLNEYGELNLIDLSSICKINKINTSDLDDISLFFIHLESDFEWLIEPEWILRYNILIEKIIMDINEILLRT